jgi:hypothetical protein
MGTNKLPGLKRQVPGNCNVTSFLRPDTWYLTPLSA